MMRMAVNKFAFFINGGEQIRSLYTNSQPVAYLNQRKKYGCCIGLTRLARIAAISIPG